MQINYATNASAQRNIKEIALDMSDSDGNTIIDVIEAVTPEEKARALDEWMWCVERKIGWALANINAVDGLWNNPRPVEGVDPVYETEDYALARADFIAQVRALHPDFAEALDKM